MTVINEAMDRIELGVKRNIKITPHEKEMTAYHEAGHAITTYLLNPTDDVMKASIIPRAETLGVVYHVPREELHSYDRQRLLALIKTSLGGYVAEKLKFNTTSNGVGSDFKKALLIAHSMVWSYGMGKSGFVGDYSSLDAIHGGWIASSKSSVISEKIREQLNMDTQEIMEQCQKEVQVLLQENAQLLDRFANELVSKSELDYDEIEAVFKEFNKARPSTTSNS